MKLQFKHKEYQADAVEAVVDCFAGKMKHVFFIAETKGSMSSLELREIESARIQCVPESSSPGSPRTRSGDSGTT